MSVSTRRALRRPSRWLAPLAGDIVWDVCGMCAGCVWDVCEILWGGGFAPGLTLALATIIYDDNERINNWRKYWIVTTPGAGASPRVSEAAKQRATRTIRNDPLTSLRTSQILKR